MSDVGGGDTISPNGEFMWDGKKWVDAPIGTIQKFVWTGEKWCELPANLGGAVFSPDRAQIWTGYNWIPAPPIKSGTDIGHNGKETPSLKESKISKIREQNKTARDINLLESISSYSSLFFVFFILSTLISSQAIQPLLLDASLIRTGRYALTFDAWDTIEDDNVRSVVGIGSSMLQYSLNGTCIEQELQDEKTYVYNLAIPGSMPYLEMIQTEAAVQASPELILLELGPNSLWSVDDYSNAALMDYFELRLAVMSISLETRHEGDWVNILRDSEREILDLGITDKFRSDAIYADDAIEEILRRVILDQSSAPRSVSAAYVPHPTEETWHEYLRTQNWLYSKLELMSSEGRSNWENTTVPNSILKGVNNPEANGTRNHEALEYMVSRFSETGIKVALISPPLHPFLVGMLEPGQYDGHNQTLSDLESYPGVRVVNLVWEDYWQDDDFFDHNHLDRHGRQTFCSAVSPIINEILEG